MAHFPFFIVQDRFARGTEGYSLYISKWCREGIYLISGIIL